MTGVKVVLEIKGSGTKTSIFIGSKVFTPGKAGMFSFFLIPNYSLIHDFNPITAESVLSEVTTGSPAAKSDIHFQP